MNPQNRQNPQNPGQSMTAPKTKTRGPAATTYGTSPIKRPRRTKTQMRGLADIIIETLTAEHPATVCGVFYRVISTGALPKTEESYRKVQREVLKLRRAGQIPYSWITDGTRLRLKERSWTRIDQMLEEAAVSYRRALWTDQPVYVEVWSEKDAITGTVYPITDDWDVPLLVARGFSSETFLHTSAEELTRQDKPCIILEWRSACCAGPAKLPPPSPGPGRRRGGWKPAEGITIRRRPPGAGSRAQWRR